MRSLHGILSLGLAAISAVIGVSSAANAQTTLKAVAFIPKNDPVLAMANTWVSDVNSKLSGKVRINFVGGPEVITRFQQPEALRTGVVDIIFVPSGDYQDQVPTSPAFVLSKISPSEERKSGFYDFMVEEHAKRMNTRYLGRVQVSPFYLWTKKEPKSLADLSGLKMRSGVLYDRLMREFGMVPVTINAPEVYTALQSGIVDGFGWPVTGPLKRGWLESTKYVVDLPFYPASNVVALLNLDKWKAMPKETQDALTALTAEFETRMVKHFDDENEAEWKAIGNKVTKVKFSDDENKRYLQAAYDVEWKALQDRAPDAVAKLRSMTGN
ncbi:TRAP transporter substrate-binding protein DctP [Rhodoplanes sp. Z2-YC6860]|uniref:TRAP transporter substrate-binding protein DctP n=1 Tax=Rhodoplanes sp. Z2-YC6860 TaxID=674703 RepID=UPI00078D163C|nr:TRAP transporter substrate-binding protein DctP [Rhodoplanes sp. Z2-YC6860]AMN43288.1 TRAP dicarboxylate transporter subunit DctP [Rhodoplanes sp. Z2-YC6860]